MPSRNIVRPSSSCSVGLGPLGAAAHSARFGNASVALVSPTSGATAALAPSGVVKSACGCACASVEACSAMPMTSRSSRLT